MGLGEWESFSNFATAITRCLGPPDYSPVVFLCYPGTFENTIHSSLSTAGKQSLLLPPKVLFAPTSKTLAPFWVICIWSPGEATLLDYWWSLSSSRPSPHGNSTPSLSVFDRCQSDSFVNFQSLVITSYPGAYYKLPVYFHLVHLLSLWIYHVKGHISLFQFLLMAFNNT